jgi:hypothetical protein
MYVNRDSDGKVVSISRLADAQHREFVAQDSADLTTFFQDEKLPSHATLEKSDQAMARVLEDLIQLLVSQGTIRFTDLPQAAQTKLLSRRELRGQIQDINLLDDGDNISL